MDGAYPKEEKESKRQMTCIYALILTIFFTLALTTSFHIGYRAGMDRAIRAWIADKIEMEPYEGGIRVRIKGDEK